jgi:tol-pal system protein YbgF
MMFRRILACSVFAAAMLSFSPTPSSGASKEIQELQRDVAQLQDQLNQLRQSQDRQLAEIRVLVQQSVAAANDAGKSVAVIQSGFQQNLRDQESKVVAPVVGLNTRMDQMSQEMRTMQQAMSDLTGLISKMQTQLTDLSNAVKVISATPAPPPPGAPLGGSSGEPSIGAGGSPPAGGAPTISATELYNTANRDRSAGKFDLALQEYQDYLRWYGNTDLAPNAQYYIAWIHASQGDLTTAIREYDAVLEKYSDNNKTPDAMFGKGMALVKLGRRTEGAREFQELAKRFPSNPLAGQACTQLANMGLKCAAPSRTAAPATKGAAPRRAGKKE